MDLVDRYLNAVRTFLPRNDQDDLVAELAANIRDEMDDRATALGRPLTEDEQDTILQRYGHPMLAAARYGARQPGQGGLVFGRALIGPALFPYYWKTLLIVIGCSLALRFVALGALATAGVPVDAALSLDSILLQIIVPFVVLTAIFTATDRSLPAWRWSARGLPAPAVPARRKHHQVSRFESIAQVIALLVVLFWLHMLFETPSLVFGPAAATYRPGSVWGVVALPTALILLAGVAQGLINLVRPDWLLLRQLTRLATDLATLALVIYLLSAGQWVAHVSAGGDTTALQTINQWVFYGLLSPAIALVGVTLWDAWKLRRSEGRRPSEPLVGAPQA